MKTTIRKKLLIAGGGAVAVFLLFAHFKQRDSYSCQTCGSTRDEIQWRVGLWPDASIPLTPKFERMHETRFLHDFFPTNHVHEWQFAQGSPYYFFGTTWGGCAIGGGRRFSEICQVYDSSPEFREFVQAKLKDGSITRSNLLILVAAPPGESYSRTNEIDFLKAFYNR